MKVYGEGIIKLELTRVLNTVRSDNSKQTMLTMVRFASLCHVNHDSTAVNRMQIFPSSSPTGKISQPRN